MAIRTPEVALNASDKKLLLLLGKLLTEEASTSNAPRDKILLSDTEAEELVQLLEKFLESRWFQESAYFVESLTRLDEAVVAKELFLSNRQHRGRSRALASIHWEDFRRRFGKAPVWNPHVSATAMPFEHFRKMEKRLFEAAGLSPRVVRMLLKFLDSQRKDVEGARSNQMPLEHGDVKRPILETLNPIRGDRRHADRELSPTKVSAAIVVIADVSVLISTRDWGVAGKMSTIAGALGCLAVPEVR